MARVLDQVLGHELPASYLLQAVAADRLPSTLMFVGPAGIGKRQVALGLAQALLCRKNREGCGHCPSCLRVEKGESESVRLVTSGNGMIRIDSSREILRFLSLSSLQSAQIVVIDDAQTMNAQAANALLKVLEEPPPQTYFFLIVPSMAGVLSTIRSRSQVVRMAPLSGGVLKELRPGLDEWMYNAARGSLSALDQLANEDWIHWRERAWELWSSLWQGQRPMAFALISEIVRDKEGTLFVVRCWQSFIRDVWVVRASQAALLNPEHRPDLSFWGGVSWDVMRKVTDLIWEMEGAIQMNLDRQLVLENTWLMGRRYLTFS
jgi:DNA polymerase-3 subunit delta'